VLLVLVVTGETARTEVLKGQSRELGIQFEVSGGASWCAPDIAVALSAAKADAFKPETVQFVQMLGRIRAIIMDQCPRVERIAFDAAAQQRAVMSIEMTRLTKWRRLVRVEPGTRRPTCPTKQQGAECDKHIDAYVLAHRLMRGDPFAVTELTSFLEEDEAGAHAVWRSGEVTGKLTIKEQSEYAGRFRSGNQLADAATDALRMLCSREGGRPDLLWSESWPRPMQEETAVRGFSCHPSAGVAEHRALIVSSAGTTFHVFALLASGADAQVARAAARDLVLAIGAAP
jgi:hypothetical protein